MCNQKNDMDMDTNIYGHITVGYAANSSLPFDNYMHDPQCQYFSLI